MGSQIIKTILVPLDGSKRAEKILPYVEELAFARELKVVFLRVLEPATFMVSTYGMGAYYDQEMAELSTNEANAYLETLTKEASSKGLDARAVVKVGLVVQSILETAEEEKADLIAMASHGRTGVARVFYGSVAAGVMHQAEKPLLLIRSVDSE